jgi:hypothetical protein
VELGLLLAVVIDVPAVVKLKAFIHQPRLMLQRHAVVNASVHMLHWFEAGERLVGAVRNTSVDKLACGHDWSLERIEITDLLGPVPLRGKERCFASRGATSDRRAQRLSVKSNVLSFRSFLAKMAIQGEQKLSLLQ